MKFSYTISALFTAWIVLGGPLITKRESGVNDVKILNYALTLEHLENAFYHEGLAKYTRDAFGKAANIFQDRGHFYDNLYEVSMDEQTHVDFLTRALGDDAVAPCTYDFPFTDPASFLALAGVLEGVGVSAYLGAAAAISNKDYLTYAGSILTVESRHSSYLRSATKHHPFAQPFDNPLNFNEVYSLAATFIASCPSENEKKPQLALKPFPALALATDGMVKTGDEIILTTPGYILAPSPGQKVYAAFLVVTGPIFLDAIRIEDGKNGSRYQMLIPNGINGQSYAVLTTCKDYISRDTIAAGPVIIEVTNKDIYGISQ